MYVKISSKLSNLLALYSTIHVRRKFTETLDENEVLATQALYFFSKLYEVEKDAREGGWSYDEIVIKRKAISYAYSLLPRLSSYILDGRYQIGNNLCENVIRPLAIGRKNYLFCKSDDSTMRAAMTYSLIGSCRAAGINPGEWFELLLTTPYLLIISTVR